MLDQMKKLCKEMQNNLQINKAKQKKDPKVHTFLNQIEAVDDIEGDLQKMFEQNKNHNKNKK